MAQAGDSTAATGRGRALRRGVARLLAALALVAAPGAALHAQPQALSPECALPDRLLTFPRALPRIEELVREKNSLKILVVGSSVEIAPPQAPRDPFSARLVAELERRFPGVDVAVKNDGVGGELAAATLERLKREVVDWGADLVVWQVGANDALARTDPQTFIAVLREGVEWLLQRSVEIVLVNPQFFPRVAHESAYRAYVEGVEEVATGESIPLLRQYQAMQHWAEKGAGAAGAGRDGFSGEQGSACVAEALAEAIARQIGPR